MKRTIVYILLISFGMPLFNLLSQEIDSTKTILINKNDVKISIIDKRVDPYTIGDIPIDLFMIQAMNPRKNVKDKRNSGFTMFNDIVKKSLKEKGFIEASGSKHLLEISLDELYYKSEDKFTYRSIDQHCFITVKLLNSSGESLYEKKFFGVYRCSLANLKRMGYKINNSGFIFLSVSIKDAIKQLFEDKTFQSIFKQ